MDAAVYGDTSLGMRLRRRPRAATTVAPTCCTSGEEQGEERLREGCCERDEVGTRRRGRRGAPSDR